MCVPSANRTLGLVVNRNSFRVGSQEIPPHVGRTSYAVLGSWVSLGCRLPIGSTRYIFCVHPSGVDVASTGLCLGEFQLPSWLISRQDLLSVWLNSRFIRTTTNWFRSNQSLIIGEDDTSRTRQHRMLFSCRLVAEHTYFSAVTGESRYTRVQRKLYPGQYVNFYRCYVWLNDCWKLVLLRYFLVSFEFPMARFSL